MKMEHLYKRIVDPNRETIHEPIYQILNAASFLYSAAMTLRSRCYRFGFLASNKLACRVVSIGNLTLGGAGKTPMTLWLAQMLKERGYRPAILSRGYKGTARKSVNVVCDGERILLAPKVAGDEPVMMAQRLKNIPVLTGVDRYSSGLLAIQQFSVDFLLLDDGYQHLALKRDCNILLLDYANPFGNGKVFPAGSLREPIKMMDRSDMICLTRCPRDDSFSYKDLVDRGISKPSVKTRLRLNSWVRLDTEEHLPPEALHGEAVSAFCGIACPDDFISLLEEVGAQTLSRTDFPDHHPYSKEDLYLVQNKSADARFVVTTEKDAVKVRIFSTKMPILFAKIDLEVIEGEEILIRSVLGNENE